VEKRKKKKKERPKKKNKGGGEKRDTGDAFFLEARNLRPSGDGEERKEGLKKKGEKGEESARQQIRWRRVPREKKGKRKRGGKRSKEKYMRSCPVVSALLRIVVGRTLCGSVANRKEREERRLGKKRKKRGGRPAPCAGFRVDPAAPLQKKKICREKRRKGG